MIIVRLMGGLGNQMFQYALGRRLSLLHNTELKIDISLLGNETSIDTKRKYELGIFGIDTIANNNDLKPYRVIQSSSFKRRLHYRLPQWCFSHHIIPEPSHAFNPGIFKSPDNSFFTGFWQTQKYFIDIAQTILDDFSFNPSLDDVNRKIAEKINSGNSVSIHIRRGDYVSNPTTQKYHGICSIEYYQSAVKQLLANQSDLQLFVFSDDTEWVKRNLHFDLPTEYIKGNTGNKSYIDMQLMSLCKHNIIANSSFSWWAAWLNKNKGKMVIAPIKWFEDSTVDTKDVIPESWIKL